MPCVGVSQILRSRAVCILARARDCQPTNQLTNLEEARADGANDRTEPAKGVSPLLGIMVDMRHDGGQKNASLEILENDDMRQEFRCCGEGSAVSNRVTYSVYEFMHKIIVCTL